LALDDVAELLDPEQIESDEGEVGLEDDVDAAVTTEEPADSATDDEEAHTTAG